MPGGLSTRDIEGLLRDAQRQRLLSRSAVSEMTEALWNDYKTFCERDLSGFEVVYIFLDAVYESIRFYRGPKEGIEDEVFVLGSCAPQSKRRSRVLVL